MPTSNQAAPAGDTDLGWGYARVVANDPGTGRPQQVDVTCKGCLVTLRLTVQPAGGITSAFPHADDCEVFRRIREHTVQEHDAPRRARARGLRRN